MLSLAAAWAMGAGWTFGCGGDSGPSIPIGDGGPGDGGDGSSPGDAAADGDAGGDEDRCKRLRNEVDRLRPAAMECDPAGSMLPCTHFVPDVCCELSVTDPERPAVKKFVKAFDEWAEADCRAMCPKRVCNAEPSRTCDPSTPIGGVCRQ